MVKGRRKSRSKSSGDFCSNDCDDTDNVGTTWRRMSITGEGIYEGHTKNGLRDGQGRQMDPKGGCFIGSWVQGLQSGFGSKSYKSGDRHEGNYYEGKRSGNGIYMWRNGDVYSGEWEKGFFDGKGSFTWASGDKYIGCWYRGEMHGQGVKSHLDGSILEGTFLRGKAHGNAKKTFSQGDVYTGNYFMDSREGYGEYCWADGSAYRGSWIKDRMTGHGEKVLRMPMTPTELCTLDFLGAPDSVLAYRGQFVDGKREGKGTAVLSDGSRYIGDWVNDVMSGWGRLEDPSGAFYEGYFLSGLKHGMGVLAYPPSRISSELLDEITAASDRIGTSDTDNMNINIIDTMLNKNVLTSLINSDVTDDEVASNEEYSLFDYSINESLSVNQILESCRDFKKRKKKNEFCQIEQKLGSHFYDFHNCCTYRGFFVNGKPHGVSGVIELRNGQVFYGNFECGLRVGNNRNN